MQLLQQVLDTHPHKPFGDTQLGRVHKAMMGGGWATLAAIASKSGVPLSTVGSRIRDLRKPRGHEHVIFVKEDDYRARLYFYRMEEKNV